MAKQMNIFGEWEEEAPKRTRSEIFNDYEGFTEKFKPKKTTDDCYTPELIYETVKQWVDDNILKLDGVPIIRPFYPGRDYRNADYPEGCVVLDNPPFSILAQIRRWYQTRGIRYFLFCPCLTIKPDDCETLIIINESIEYENKASVATGFITNLDTRVAIWCAGDLSDLIKKAKA